MNRANLLVEITAFIAFKRYLNSLVLPNITTKVSGITKTQSVICIINTIILTHGMIHISFLNMVLINHQ